MKHTKGEWTYKPALYGARYDLYAETKTYIKSFGQVDFCIGFSNKLKKTEHGEDLRDEAESNAKLIAAAPEMLDLLIEIFDKVNIGDYSIELYKRTKTVIKKATL